jgi:hypothetical protein
VGVDWSDQHLVPLAADPDDEAPTGEGGTDERPDHG